LTDRETENTAAIKERMSFSLVMKKDTLRVRIRDQGCGMRAMGGTVKWPARCCSRSDRICQIRPSTKPIAIANEISKTINTTKISGMFLAQPRAPARFRERGPGLRLPCVRVSGGPPARGNAIRYLSR